MPDSKMRSCSVCKHLQVVPGCPQDYKALACYHYRDSHLGPFVAIFSLKGDSKLSAQSGISAVGVIAYTMPTPGCQLRNLATSCLFAGLDRKTQLHLINKNIRTISRVIIEPRFRCLGLASRLVSETMPLMNVTIIEAQAVMGWVNPFFEKAGMSPYIAPLPARCVRLIEAFSTVGIEKLQLIDAEFVQQKLTNLSKGKAEFIESEIKRFLQSYGKRRTMLSGIERTKYILTKLTDRPVYYIWLNPNLELRV